MEITLPPKNDLSERIVLQNPHNIVIIGANGAGKSRFGEEIEREYPEQTFRISALNSVCIVPDSPDSPNSIARQFKEAFSEKSASQTQTEFEQLFCLLQYEEFKTLTEYKERLKNEIGVAIPVTKLDRTQVIWEKIFPHSRLLRKPDRLEIISDKCNNPYNALRMSQGERVVFYLIAAALSASPDSILIIEDPEVHLHRSIMSSLWDYIEQERPDCTFVYLTHDIEFATTRTGGIRIWVKSYDADQHSWDYELIENQELFPEEVYLELLGSRKPILFIEGTDSSSIDIKLYPYIFPEYMVKPLGGCSKVIETTKAFAEMKGFHHLESKGIVDRDRRTPHEIKYLRERNIYVPDVAEVENLLMLEPIIRVIARRMLQNEDEVFHAVKQNVIAFFKKDIESQALLHTRHRTRREIEYTIDRRLNTIEEFTRHIETLTDNIDTDSIYRNILEEFIRYAENEDYPAILRVYNQKGMLPQSRVTHLCGLANKEKYLSFVLSILKEDKEDAATIRKAIQACFGIVQKENEEEL